jgi:hypothetical protein
VEWADGGRPAWIEGVSEASVFVEWGFSDFGNPDIVIVTGGPTGVRCVFIEAKIGPYILSMRPNSTGMSEPGFNSSINGQLALKYRFAKALECATAETATIEESNELFHQYRKRVSDLRTAPRRLAKPEIIAQMFSEHGLIGLPEERWCYVTLTWDAAEKAFFRDDRVKQLDGLPLFLSEAGDDLFTSMAARVGWVGYQRLEQALGLRQDPEYIDAFRTMEGKNQPNDADYVVAAGALNGGASPEALALAAKLREDLFARFDVAQYPGSYSIKEGGQTIGKIIPKLDAVFVGIRETRKPEMWFGDELQTLSIQGVRFMGIYVPVESRDMDAVERLVRGLSNLAAPGQPQTT